MIANNYPIFPNFSIYPAGKTVADFANNVIPETISIGRLAATILALPPSETFGTVTTNYERFQYSQVSAVLKDQAIETLAERESAPPTGRKQKALSLSGMTKRAFSKIRQNVEVESDISKIKEAYLPYTLSELKVIAVALGVTTVHGAPPAFRGEAIRLVSVAVTKRLIGVAGLSVMSES
jgi:hypothetical protein